MIDAEKTGERIRDTLRSLDSAIARGIARLSLHGVDRVGARPKVHGFPFVENLGKIVVGDDLELFASPVRSHLVTGKHGLIEIGDRVTIGAGVGIAAEARIRVGNDVDIAPFVMILDTDYHAVEDRDAPGAAAPIVIGDGARLDERVTVLRGASIGRGAYVEAGSVVSGIVPDGARVSGVPAIVHLRAPEIAPSPPRVAGEAELAARIQRVAKEVFALPAMPASTDGPAQIHAWDSLGALRLLVSVEEELGISLPQDTLASVRDLAGLCNAAARRLERGPSPAVSGAAGP